MDRLDTVRVFVTVAELEGFAAAARRLGRTPASVTRAVGDLEAHLRTRLLNRTTRAVSLTDAGARYLEIGRRLLATHAEFESLEPDGETRPQGVLAVTAPANFGRLHLLPLVAPFLDRYPALTMRLLLVDRVVSLVEEGLDVAVRLGELPDSSLRAMRAGSVRLGVYASPDYLARHGTPKAPSDLAEHRVVSCVTVTPAPDRWPLGTGPAIAVTPRLVVDTTDAAADAASAGLGPTLLVDYQVAHHLAAGRLVEVLPEHPFQARPIHLVHPSGRHTPAKVRLFVEEIGRGLRARFDRT